MQIAITKDDQERDEFFRDPLWKEVLAAITRVTADLQRSAAVERDDHPFKAGKLAGAELVLSHLNGLIAKGQHRG